MLGDTPVTVYWTMLYSSCILLVYSFCDSSHIVTKRSILFRVSTKATIKPGGWKNFQNINERWGHQLGTQE